MWYVKQFDDLELSELEQILRLRQSIFIIEQRSFFEDIDGLDSKAIHIFLKKENLIIAYSRVVFDNEKLILGRITIPKSFRGNGTGRILVERSLKFIEENFPDEDVHIVAMSYLRKFYHSLGFKTVSDVYIMDDDEHEDMILERKTT